VINIKYITKRAIPTMVATVTALSAYSCSTKKENSEKEKMNINNSTYTLEQYTDIPYLYNIQSYDSEKAKGTPYEMKKVQKSYNTKCTPKEFEKYTNEKNITWSDLKNTVNNSKFDNNHKNILLKGIDNLEKNNFNMNLSAINYNIKNISIEYVDEYHDEDILGEFSCFEHKITLSKNINDQSKYELVFLHEMLGHGMTDAYIDDTKVYCSIDTPTYVTDPDNNFIGYSLYGEAFTESTAQIIAITALDKQLSPEYMSGYDLNMTELLMLCKDNNCEIAEYADNGINYLIKKMKQNKIDNPYDLIAMTTYNLETAEMNMEIKKLSEQIMYEYFCERVSDKKQEGKSLEEINKDIQEIFNYFGEYILVEIIDNDNIVANNKDYINLTRLYEEIGNYALGNTKSYKYVK